MKVLVTGIDGFVGSHAAEYLLGLGGVELHGTHFPRQKTGNIDHLRGRITLHETDIVDADALRQIFMALRPDKVVHLAGQAFVPTALRDPFGTFNVNIMGGVALLDAARHQAQATGAGPDILLVSSGEVYGKSHLEPISEDSPVRPENPYAVSKASVDLIGQEYRRTFGLRVSVVRPFNHAGPRQSPVFVSSDFGRQFALIAASKQEPVIRAGNIEARRDFTDVRDVVRAYWAILTHPSEHMVFNLCSGRIVANSETCPPPENGYVTHKLRGTDAASSGFAGARPFRMPQLRTRRWCVDGIFMSSRYLATVRRVTLMPRFCKRAVICSSVSGLVRSSSPIIFFTMRLSSSSGVPPPNGPCTASEKK